MEKEIQELGKMESDAIQQTPKEIKEKKKVLKLTFKEKMAIERLPLEIEKLELEIEEKNLCLANPKCYEEIGINTLADELKKLEDEYETKVEELLEIEEKVEEGYLV